MTQRCCGSSNGNNGPTPGGLQRRSFMKPIQMPMNQIQESKRHLRSWQSVHHESSYIYKVLIAADAPISLLPHSKTTPTSAERHRSRNLPQPADQCDPLCSEPAAHRHLCEGEVSRQADRLPQSRLGTRYRELEIAGWRWSL